MPDRGETVVYAQSYFGACKKRFCGPKVVTFLLISTLILLLAVVVAYQIFRHYVDKPYTVHTEEQKRYWANRVIRINAQANGTWKVGNIVIGHSFIMTFERG